jgi:multidrug efflux pump subunit AcrA (membrane-fusion protein)
MTGDTELGLLLHDAFPEPEPPTEQLVAEPRPGRRFRRPRTLITVVIVVVLIAAAGGIWAATGSSAATYRWTTVTSGDVDQTLNSYGTVTPIHQANVTFPVSGTVATVPVTVGQHVTAGQTLATLEVSSLQSKLDSTKSTLATAEAKLVADQQAQATGTTVAATNTSATLGAADTGQATPLSTRRSSGGTGGSGTGVGGTGAGGTGAGGTGAGGTGGSALSAQSAVTAAQAKLLADQHTVDNLTATVAADLRLGTATCASLIASLQNLTVTPLTPTPSASPSAPASGGSGSSQVPDTSACTTLLNRILADQQAVTAAQTTVSNDETALTTAVNNLVAAAKSGGSGGSSGGSTSGSGGSGGSGSSGSGSSGGSSLSGSGRSSGSGGNGGGTSVTADQLVVDQTTVDADVANAIVAAEAVNQATLVSPLAGTVAAVNVSAGSTAGTSSAAVTVIGPGADLVATTVSDLDLKEIHVGADASVTPDGSNTPVHGTVTAIGLLPVSTTSSSSSGSSISSTGRGGSTAAASSSSSSSSSPSSTSSSATYPVTISLDTGGLYSGSGADVSIVVKKLTNVLAVPTSAVTTLGPLHTVMLQSGGKGARRVVVVGASDATFTQITSGLTNGQRVALAQVNLPVPSSGSTNLARLAGGGGGGGGFARSGATGTGRPGTAGATRTGG